MTRHDVVALLVELGLIKAPNNQRRVFIQLGKFGDIINILPALRVLSQQCGEPVNLMVSKDYAGLVAELSYVEPVIFDGNWFQGLTEAVALAKQRYDEVIVTQATGRDYHYTRCEPHFNMEAWRMSGMGAHYYTAKLVLDNRDFEREQKLADTVLKAGVPNVLVNLSGESSPLHAGPTLMEWFRTAMPEVNLVDIGKLKAESITDILGLYDRSVCLLTTDTATLHLARSHPIPVVALCSEGWFGSHSVANVLFRCTYKQVWHHLSTICHVIKRCSDVHPKMILLRQNYGRPTQETIDRECVAEISWLEYGRGVVATAFKPSDFPNATAIGDIDAPDIKSVLDKFILDNPRDIIIFANNDICVLPDAVSVIRKAVNRHGCFYSARYDVDEVVVPRAIELEGREYAGADLFAFTADWWKTWRDKFPNLYLGFEGFDFVLRALMLESGLQPTRPVIVHEKHESSNWKFKNDRPAQKHNRSVCRKWAIENGYVEYLLPEGHDFLFRAL